MDKSGLNGKGMIYMPICDIIREKRSSKDILKAILAFTESDCFDGTPRKIQSAIYNLKKNYQGVFEDIDFNLNQLYPYSEKLERMIFRLKHSMVINVDNPEYRKYRISGPVKMEMKKEAEEKYDNETLETIKKMSRDFESQTKLDGE